MSPLSVLRNTFFSSGILVSIVPIFAKCGTIEQQFETTALILHF